MPLLIEASRAYVTMGEMCDALRETWRETPSRACDADQGAGLARLPVLTSRLF